MKKETMMIFAGLYVGIELLYATFMGSIAALMVSIVVFCGIVNWLSAVDDRIRAAKKEA